MGVYVYRTVSWFGSVHFSSVLGQHNTKPCNAIWSSFEPNQTILQLQPNQPNPTNSVHIY